MLPSTKERLASAAIWIRSSTISCCQLDLQGELRLVDQHGGPSRLREEGARSALADAALPRRATPRRSNVHLASSGSRPLDRIAPDRLVEEFGVDDSTQFVDLEDTNRSGLSVASKSSRN